MLITKPAARIGLVSCLILISELALIRYMSCEIPAVGFFKNLVLMAAFLGVGVGVTLRMPPRASYVAFAAAALLPHLLLLGIREFGLEQYAFAGGQDEAILVSGTYWTGLALVAFTFVVTLAPMAFLGQLLGRYFAEFPSAPLAAYGWNIAGSLVGTVLYSLICAFAAPPEIWFGVVFALFASLCVLEWPVLGWQTATTALVLGGVALLLRGESRSGDEVWTPYYKVQLFEMAYRSGQQTGYGLRVNNTWFQRSFDMRYLGGEEESEEDAHAARNLRFSSPFLVVQPKRVLVLGSGLGNDTAAALQFGAERVDAVDIDPGIVALSDGFHPNHPYTDSRVHVHVDDARRFLSYTSERYDLILLGVLEARSLFSQFANLRLDNYVYTVEGIRAARDRLNPAGVVWLNMWVPKPWLVQKLEGVMRENFGTHYLVLHGTGSEHFAFVGGPSLDPASVRRSTQHIPAVNPAMGQPFAADVTIPTDDWPYVFYRTRQIPVSYLTLLVVLIALSVVPLRMVCRDLFDVRWPFFFLGAAFLLVETSAVVRMALIAGTTWIVNSCVFAGVLCFALVSNWIALRWHVRDLFPVFAGLAVSLLVCYAFPFQDLLKLPAAAAVPLAAGVLTGPLLFSGIIFSTLLRDEAVPSRALASNLFGAIFGGFAEYSSMLAGNRAMSLVALCLYLVTFELTRRRAVP